MNICVYGASSNTIDKKYIEDGEELGRLLAERGHTLIFGAGNGGLMGASARGVYEKGGKTVGVAPRFFSADGILFPHCDELLRTDTMRQRKQLMEDRSDAFIMAPGGIGTFEEFFEILTLKQLGRHQKPIAVLNTNGYYNPLLELLDSAVQGNFMTDKNLLLFGVFDTPQEVLDYVETTKDAALDITHYKDVEN